MASCLPLTVDRKHTQDQEPGKLARHLVSRKSKSKVFHAIGEAQLRRLLTIGGRNSPFSIVDC